MIDEFENQAEINRLAEEASRSNGKSLRERLARMSLEWADAEFQRAEGAAGQLVFGTTNTRITGKIAANELRLVGKEPNGDPIYERPSVPRIGDPQHMIAGMFAPAPPGIAKTDHWAVVEEWIAEEELSERLHAGGAFDAILEAAKVMTARQIIKTVERVGEEIRAEGQTLWVGPKTAKAHGEVIKDVKPQLLEALNGKAKETAGAGPVCGVRAANGSAAGGASPPVGSNGAHTGPPAGNGEESERGGEPGG